MRVVDDRERERERDRLCIIAVKSCKLKCSIFPAASPARPSRGQITECLSSHLVTPAGAALRSEE